jgi:hypothetical protein
MQRRDAALRAEPSDRTVRGEAQVHVECARGGFAARADRIVCPSWIHFGLLCHEDGRARAGRRFIQSALTLCRQLDDVRGAAMCLNVVGLVEVSDGHYRLSRSLHEESLALSRRIGDRWGTAWALTNSAGTCLYTWSSARPTRGA